MTTTTTRRRVLVAEDDEGIATILVRTLGLDFDVSLARNGHEAVALAGQTRPDLLLLDVMMPGIDGLQVSRLVRKLDGLGHVPIIFLTAKDRPADVISGIQHGARHYITKPFKIADVRDKVKKVLKP